MLQTAEYAGQLPSNQMRSRGAPVSSQFNKAASPKPTSLHFFRRGKSNSQKSSMVHGCTPPGDPVINGSLAKQFNVIVAEEALTHFCYHPLGTADY